MLSGISGTDVWLDGISGTSAGGWRPSVGTSLQPHKSISGRSDKSSRPTAVTQSQENFLRLVGLGLFMIQQDGLCSLITPHLPSICDHRIPRYLNTRYNSKHN